MPRARPRKRPCRICRRWFLPNARLRKRQVTCADPDCQRKWHTKKCREWNRANKAYFRANYLQNKLDAVGDAGGKPAKSRLNTGLPSEVVQAVIGIKHLVIIEYMAQFIRQTPSPKAHPNRQSFFKS